MKYFIMVMMLSGCNRFTEFNDIIIDSCKEGQGTLSFTINTNDFGFASTSTTCTYPKYEHKK